MRHKSNGQHYGENSRCQCALTCAGLYDILGIYLGYGASLDISDTDIIVESGIVGLGITGADFFSMNVRNSRIKIRAPAAHGVRLSGSGYFFLTDTTVDLMNVNASLTSVAAVTAHTCTFGQVEGSRIGISDANGIQTLNVHSMQVESSARVNVATTQLGGR